MKLTCTNKQDFIKTQCLSESALGMIRSCVLHSFEHTLRKLTWRLHYLWCRIYIYIYNHNNNTLQKMRRLMKNCYITHGIGINSKDLCWMNKCNWYVLYSLYKAPLWLIGRCFYCMDCSCLFTFWRWSVLIYYIHISVKFLNGVFFQQQKKKIIPQCSCI